VGKHTDALIEELVVSTEGKTDCQEWDTDGWVDTRFVLPPEVEHYIGQDRTQRLERTNGILRYSNGEMASRLRISLGSSGS
jgi:IS1 family transposase